MKAVCIHSFGGPDVLKLEELPCPEPREDEVLVRIAAAGVNPIDYKIRTGQFAKPEQLPVMLGRDISGTIVRCGAQVRDWREGDEVFAMLPPERGGYAEYVALNQNQIVRKPDSLDHEHAAAVPLAALTAWQGLVDQGHLQPGQRVLIHGAAGGVGHFAVQFAKSIGAEVIATATRADADFLHALGADKVIDYRTERFENEVHDVDLVLDLVGGKTQERSWSVLKPGGALVSTLGPPPQEKARAQSVRGVGYIATPNVIELTQIAALIDAEQVRPFVQSSYLLSEAGQAQEHLAHEHTRGKTVLKVAYSEAA